MDTAEVRVPRSVLDGVPEAVCQALGIGGTRHRSALRSLRLAPDGDIVDVIFRAIADNYARGGAAAKRDASRENWRWPRPKTNIAANNESPEVRLERAIAAAAERTGNLDWANQIPVASGLIGTKADRRRAIDLVHRRGPQNFEFLELKVGSDTPLHAAVEIIGYGCLWLLARSDPPARASAILEASHVDLRVLAPSAYYTGYELSELEAALDAGCRRLGKAQNIAITFAFNVLDNVLLGSIPTDDAALLAAIDRSTLRRASLVRAQE